MAYSMDYRKRAVEYKGSGHSFKELREAFKISSQTYYNWRKKLESGYYENKTIRRRLRKINLEELKAIIEAHPDVHLRDLADTFGCAQSAISAALKKINIKRKNSIWIQNKPYRETAVLSKETSMYRFPNTCLS